MTEEVKVNEKKAQEQENKSSVEILRELCRGRFELTSPLRSGGQDVTELQYDFCALTGEDLLDALDSTGGQNLMGITNRQAINLFARTASKCTTFTDDQGNARHFMPSEIIKGMSAVDTIKAVQQAKLFYTASTRATNKKPDENQDGEK